MADEDNTIVEEEQTEPMEELAVEESPEETPREEDPEVTTLRSALEERETRITALEEESGALREELASALQKYRSSLLASVPEVPEEMVQGETIQQLEESFAHARGMVEWVRNDLEAQASRERVPAGAPVRSTPDLSSLSPRETIAYGLTSRQG
jgi:hypothetical protein